MVVEIMKNWRSFYKDNLYFLSLIWNISPIRIIFTFLFSFLEFFLWAFNSVVFMEYLFGVEDNIRTIREILLFLWITILVEAIIAILDAWYKNSFLPENNIKINYYLKNIMFEKAQSVDLSCYENPYFYDVYNRAAKEVEIRATMVLETTATLVSSFLSSVFVLCSMMKITRWSLAFVLFPLIGNLIVGKKISKIHFYIEQEKIPFRRKTEYVNRVIYFKKYAGDLRLTKAFSILKKFYCNAVDSSVDVICKSARSLFLFNFLKSNMLYVFGFEAMWTCGAFLALNEKIALNDFVVLSSAIVSLTWMLNGFSQAVNNMFSNSLFINNFKAFLQYIPLIDERNEGIQVPKKIETIEFKNVSFRYPHKKNLVLKNINLTLNFGKKYVLVGLNGSGKTTLIKLLLRFYDPTSGEILLNGINIKEYKLSQYRKIVGATFQNFALFSISIGENILLKEIVSKTETQNVITAIKKSGAYYFVERLPLKENTILTKEFDTNGVELSGGEKQRIAIARAFANEKLIIIMDEPSSALDPISEDEMFKRTMEICSEKLSLIVSHRLSSAKLADEIYVIDKGEIIERGTHQQLMHARGKYADMYKKQSQQYFIDGSVEDK